MRTLFGPALAIGLVLGCASSGFAQMVYTGGGRAPYPGGYSFKDEPLMSINRSYLGYSNFTYYGPGNPGPFAANTARPAAPARVVAPAPVAAPAPVYVQQPVRRRFGLFGWRRYPY